MNANSVLVVESQLTPGLTHLLRNARPDLEIIECDDSGTVVAHSATCCAVIIRTDTNGGLARVRQIRKATPLLPIIVVSERDRSSGAYMAGANEFVYSSDGERLLHVLQEAVPVAPRADAQRLAMQPSSVPVG